jgi:L-seryl-tRNA(Ser) seleniumtransferase
MSANATAASGNDVYAWLGVKKRVNAAGLVTRLGGSLMSEDVLAAMREAASHYVDISELQTKASTIIARHTGAEAGIVTSGAAAGLTMATAACITGHDVAKMERLPDTTGIPNEVIMYRSHRNAYDHAVRAAGAKICEIGLNDRGAGAGVRELEPWEIEAAITPNTVAVVYTVTPTGQPPLRQVTEVANRHKVPVIVDAAAQLPPKENLRAFIDAGASLVAFSGGKAIRGPQGTGILCGRRDLISAALIQQLDMDVAPETWNPPEGLLSSELLKRYPHHGLGRGFKIDKESVVGLLVALERFANADIEPEIREKEGLLQFISDRLQKSKCVQTGPAQAKGKGSYPALEITFDEKALNATAYQLSKKLHQGTPPIHLSERRAHEGMLVVDSSGLRPGDEKLIADALIALVG